jgi:hypothetical protein
MNDRSPGAHAVISQSVRPEFEAEFARWQGEVSAAARQYPGFESTEIIRPQPGVQDDWVIVYRFDTAEHLAAWLGSDERRALRAKVEPCLAPPTERVLARAPSGERPVTVVISRRVARGREREYERWLEGIGKASQRFPGYLGTELLRPVPGVQDEWVVVLRFASPETMDHWLESDVRRAWLERADEITCDFALQRLGGGLGGWFPAGDAPGASTPPRWKQALTVLFVLYPTVTFSSRLLHPRLDFLADDTRRLLLSAVSVALLTWFLMPPVNRALRFWLQPRRRRDTVLGTALVLGLLGAMLGLFSRLP